MKPLLFFAAIICTLSLSAQKIVFTDPYDARANIDTKEPTGRLFEDSVSKTKMLVICDKQLNFYLLDADWKLVKKFSKPYTAGTVLKENFYKIRQRSFNQNKWSFIGSAYGFNTKETIDFTAQTHQVQAGALPGLTNVEYFFDDEGIPYSLYYTQSGQLKVTSFDNELKPNHVALKLSTQLPTSKSKKYEPQDYYREIQLLSDNRVANPATTKKKAQFYILKDAYAFLLSYNEPLAEMSWYDKKTGNKIKSKIFSVEEEAKGKDCNTAALLYDNKVFVFAASKSGGVLGVFDPESGKRLYTKTYTDNDDKSVFNYGPVMYETRPGDGVDMFKNVKEKVDDISMDKFCKEMLKNSCAITIKNIDNYGRVVSFASHDEKELGNGASNPRSISSPFWFISTSAGLVFEPGTLNPSKKTITWNEVNKWSDATDRYKKIEKPQSGSDEYAAKKAFVIMSQFIRDKSYVIYLYNGQLKIHQSPLSRSVSPTQEFE